MERLHRLSMNTSLRDARVFDDDAWDEEPPLKFKKEPLDYDATGEEPPLKLKEESLDYDTKANSSQVKLEVKEEPDDEFEEESHDDTFEEGQLADSFCNNSIKQEFIVPKPSPSRISMLLDKTMEEGELEDSYSEHHMSKCKTPPPPKISVEGEFETSDSEHQTIKCNTPPPPSPPKISPVDKMFDESPYNKEMFKTLKIKEETPVKTEIAEELSGSNSRNTLKSAKRTVFNRHSPYKKVGSDNYENKGSVKSRLGPKRVLEEKGEDKIPRAKKHRRVELETDPETIARREKQIEYGKNTIGYENYLKMVPKSERKPEDPQTPKKFVKYSRRGWEGLIKQWRIKLHNYDPPESSS